MSKQLSQIKDKSHVKYFLTLVFASIVLFSSGILVHNAFADQVIATIPVENNPYGIGVNPNTNMIYVSNYGNNTVSVIDGNTNDIVNTIPLGTVLTRGLAVNPVTNMIYVSARDSLTYPVVAVIDGSTNTLVQTIRVPTQAGSPQSYDVTVNPVTNMIYSTYYSTEHFGKAGPSGGWIAVINGTTNTYVNSTFVNGFPNGITVNQNTNKIYSADFGGFSPGPYSLISVMDGSTNSVVDNINVTTYPSLVTVNPVTNMIYATDTGKLEVIDGTTDGVVHEIPINNPEGITINLDTNKIYVSSQGNSSNISVIDGSSNQVTETIPVESIPYEVAVNQNTNRIYVANYQSNTVSVIDSSPAPSATLDASFQTYQFGIIQILGNVQNPIPGVNQTQLLVYAPNGNLVLNKTEPTAFEDWYGISRSEGKGNYTIILKYNNDVLANNSLASWINNDPVIGFIDPSEASDGSVSIQSGVGYSLAGEPISVAINDSSNSTLATFTVPLLGKGQFNFEINSTTAKQIFTKSGNYTIVLTHVPTGVQRSAVLTYTASTTTSSAPQNLQSTADNSQVALSWSTPQNNGGSSITNYNVYRGTSSGGETLLAQVGNDTSYTDGTVTNGQTYFYTVTAVNSVGESYPSNEVSATPIGPPQPPTGLTATGALLKISLSWNAPSNDGGSPITGYMIEKSTDNGNTWATIVSGTGRTGTTYSDSNVLPLVTYTYRVSTINDVGTSNPSNIASATTTSTAPPPTGITLNNIQSTSGTVSSSNQMTLANFNTGTGNNKLLVVGISADSSDVNSITFNGMSLTRKAGSFYNNDAEFWYLKNPIGTGDIVVTMNGQTSAVIGAYSFSGVNQTNPMPTHVAKHNTTPNSPNITMTTKFANDWVLDLPSIYGGSTLGSPTCMQQWNDNVPDAITGASSSQVVQTPGAVTCKWTASSVDFWDDTAIEINASK